MISVIVPLYKGKKYVGKIVGNISSAAAMLRQNTGETTELILVNDFPEEKIELQKMENIQINLVTHEKNMGIQSARITGLNIANGEYILFLDQDDYIDEDFLTSQFKNRGNGDVVVSNGFHISGKDKNLFYKNKLAARLIESYKAYLYGTDMIFSPGQCLIKKEAIPDEWINNKIQYNGCDDFFLWILMFKSGAVFKANLDTFYYHVNTGKNYSGSSDNMNLSLESMIVKLKDMCKISSKEERILNNRLEIKKLRKKSGYGYIRVLLRNPNILKYTLLYKVSGYK